MDLSSLLSAFGPYSNAVFGALGVGLVIFLFPVVMNALLHGVLHLHEDVSFHFPEGSVWHVGSWLNKPLCVMYTLGSVGLVVHYIISLLH